MCLLVRIIPISYRRGCLSGVTLQFRTKYIGIFSLKEENSTFISLIFFAHFASRKSLDMGTLLYQPLHIALNLWDQLLVRTKEQSLKVKLRLDSSKGYKTPPDSLRLLIICKKRIISHLFCPRLWNPQYLKSKS